MWEVFAGWPVLSGDAAGTSVVADVRAAVSEQGSLIVGAAEAANPCSGIRRGRGAALALDDQGWVIGARRIESPNCDERPPGEAVRLVVIHAISLPPGQFGGDDVFRLFTNTLDPSVHPFFAGIAGLRVSAHFLIRRDGQLVQFVSGDRRAWHAGVSCWRGHERCNDFSLGIELEGDDFHSFTAAQYRVLRRLLAALRARYPIEGLAAHSDIAPGRKTDPGPHFDWRKLALNGTRVL